MNGDQVIEPGNYTPDELRAAMLLRDFEVTPHEEGGNRKFIKANTHGEAAVRWAESEDWSPRRVGAPSSRFSISIDVSVAEVLGRLNEARGPAKRFTLQTRFVRTYDVREAQ